MNKFLYYIIVLADYSNKYMECTKHLQIEKEFTRILLLTFDMRACMLNVIIVYHLTQRSKYTPFTVPPRIVFWTFCSNRRLFACNSFAASLFRGSSGLGSKNKY